MNVENIQKDLKKLANPEKAKILQGFFKTGKGQYGEDDIFLGIVVPEQRKVAKKYSNLNLGEIKKLLSSKIHEHRLVSLFILANQYQKADKQTKKKIFNFYLKNAKNINNWDLVDLSAPNIVGDYLLNKDKSILYKLAKSKNIWEKRIAIMATFSFIRNNGFDATLKISEILLEDEHDLIHKAVGWMLRELGKRNQAIEEKFLKKYDKELWARSHVVWHAAVVGMTTDPILMSRYVCSDEPLTDQLMGFEQLQCDKTPRRYPRLVYGIFNQPSDMHGFQAAVRYLRKRGSDEQIGSEIRKPGYFNIKWDRYDEIMRKVYFDMLRQNPIDSLYMYAIVKPLKYLKEAAMYTKYFGKSLLRSQSTLGVLGILVIVFTLHHYLVRGFRHLLANVRSHLQDEAKILPRQLLIVFISSLTPSILFYSQTHIIADSVVVLLALGLSLHITWRSLRTI